MRGSQGSDTLFGWAGNPAYRGAQQPTDHIRYSQHSGFFGITPQDRELWLRKYPHLDDFELTVKEGHEWVSRQWDKARRAEERPREFLEWWLAGEWIPMSGYREPETVCNPGQLSDFIEQYFKAGELIERATRGKHDGFPESLARKHCEKALGHAVKLRSVAPQFPETPEATDRPYIDLRRLQEWCVECEEIAKKLYGKVKVEDIEKALQFLRGCVRSTESSGSIEQRASEEQQEFDSGWQRQTQFADGSANRRKPSASSEDSACRCHPENVGFSHTL